MPTTRGCTLLVAESYPGSDPALPVAMRSTVYGQPRFELPYDLPQDPNAVSISLLASRCLMRSVGTGTSA